MVMSNIVEGPDRRIREWLGQLKSFRLSTPIESIKKSEETNEDNVNVAAYYLSLEEKSYDALCWILAEKILKKTYPTPAEDDIGKNLKKLLI